MVGAGFVTATLGVFPVTALAAAVIVTSPRGLRRGEETRLRDRACSRIPGERRLSGEGQAELIERPGRERLRLTGVHRGGPPGSP